MSLLEKKASSICLSLACKRLPKLMLLNFCKQLHLQLTSKYTLSISIYIHNYCKLKFHIELKSRLLGKAKLQSIQLYLFGPKDSHTLVKGYSFNFLFASFYLNIGQLFYENLIYLYFFLIWI